VSVNENSDSDNNLDVDRGDRDILWKAYGLILHVIVLLSISYREMLL